MSDVNIYPKMVFKAYTKNTFLERKKSAEGKDLEYTVMINPATIDRTFSTQSTESKRAKSGKSSGNNDGTKSETYKFDLYFDGTGVAGKVFKGKGLADNFQSFLDTVYAYSDNPKNDPEPNFVVMCFGTLEFKCKLSSLSVNYLLFNTDGTPLRIKASCSFTSVGKPKPTPTPKSSGGAKAPDPPPLPPQPDNCQCVCPAPTPEENMCKARENNSSSLLTSSYTPADMSQN